jgi:hypothetical protein
MTTEKDRDRVKRLIGANANAVHRNPDRALSQRTARGGNAEKRTAGPAGVTLASVDEKKNVSMQFTFKEPGVHCVQFSLNVPPIVIPTSFPVKHAIPVKAEALITWETNGNTVTRRVTVSNGMTIQGVGEAVKVVIYDTTTVGSVQPTPLLLVGFEYSVAVSCAPGSRGSFTNPPFLVEDNAQITVLGGAFATVAVPPDAGAVSVCCLVGNNGSVPIPEQGAQVFQEHGSFSQLAVYDPRAFGFAPLFPGVDNVILWNQTLLTQVWQVFWGIDG